MLFYTVPSVFSTQGIGGGDIKAAFPIGMVAAAQSWSSWWIVAIVPFCVTALVGIGQFCDGAGPCASFEATLS